MMALSPEFFRVGGFGGTFGQVERPDTGLLPKLVVRRVVSAWRC